MGKTVLYYGFLKKSFHFPLFMTLVHLVQIFILSTVSRAVMQCYTKRSRVVLTWSDYLKKVAPTALATALDIGLSNWSFLYITVSLYTMTKSSAVLFILFFSLVFKLEELRAALILVVLLIAGGLFMFTYESTQFNVEGFVLVLLASFLGGIRWTLTQILMQKAELGLQNPIDAMFHLQPLMFLSLFPLFIVIEGEKAPKMYRAASSDSGMEMLLHSSLPDEAISSGEEDMVETSSTKIGKTADSNSITFGPSSIRVGLQLNTETGTDEWDLSSEDDNVH